ncbi:MAG: antiviral reverse transcriptase Drt3a [Thalassolituus sp.]|jgi:hypothetical protein
MLKQVFSPEVVQKVLTSNDVREIRPPHGVNESEWVSSKIELKNNSIKELKSGYVKGRTVYYPSDPIDRVMINIVDRFIRRIYSVKQSDRASIVSQVKSLLNDQAPLYIVRCDIKSCFENIKFENIATKLEADCILAPDMVDTIKSVIERCHDKGVPGLPRGLSISTTLCELYLENFDDFLKRDSNVVYYARYVDDFIVICDEKYHKSVIDKIEDYISGIGLELHKNGKKYYSNSLKGSSFDFLGYSFSRVGSKVKISISDAKLNKIKTKILLAFLDYKKNSDFSLLVQRINYLSVMKVVRHSSTGNILGGIIEQYKSLDDFEVIKNIDRYYNGIIVINKNIFSSLELRKLKKISFYSRCCARSSGSFSRIKSCKINRVWKNV